MTQPPNPIMQGLRALRRNPLLPLLEIIWRWSFAAVAGLIVFGAPLLFLDHRDSQYLMTAFQSKDPRSIGASMLMTALVLGPKLIIAIIAIPLVIALVWTVFCAVARRVTARGLNGAEPLGLGAMHGLQFVRAFATWMAYLLIIGATVAGFLFATRHSRFDPVVLYSTAVPAILLVVVLWLILNWRISVAAIFGRQGQNGRAAFRDSRRAVRAQRSDFAGTGVVFLVFRVILLALAVAICGLTSRMQGTAPESYVVLVTVVVLVYFALSDVLYVWRMAAYVALVNAAGQDVIAELQRSVTETSLSDGAPLN